MTNPFVKFYGENNISPVRQNIDDLSKHFLRRENLYRTIGLAPFSFRERRILEVGPGGGYNFLHLFAQGADVDFVEPNLTAQLELGELLAKHGIARDRWTLFGDVVEKYETSKTYDVVLAEGFIPGLYHRDQVILKLKSLVSEGGVIVVTCVDELSLFFEHLKRMVAYRLISGMTEFESKVRKLVEAFESHYLSLGHVSRLVQDWAIDAFLNPAGYGEMFGIDNCIQEFGDSFDFLGSSPSMFTNYSWYKDTHYNHYLNVLEQFSIKRHALLLFDLPESTRKASENEKLVELATKIRTMAKKIQDNNEEISFNKIIVMLADFKVRAFDIDPRIPKIIDETVFLLQKDALEAEDIRKAKNFGTAFGRGQQYVTLVKRGS